MHGNVCNNLSIKFALRKKKAMEYVENTAVLVAIGSPKGQEETDEHLDELAFLAETSGIKTINRVVQNLQHPDPRTFLGKGKMEELKQFVVANKVQNVIFDEDLSPSQLRNLERIFNPKEQEDFKVRVYDRSLLILDILFCLGIITMVASSFLLTYFVI